MMWHNQRTIFEEKKKLKKFVDTFRISAYATIYFYGFFNTSIL